MRAFLIALLALMPLPALAAEQTPILSLSGVGTVHRAPDMATVSVGVETSASTAAAALAENTQAVSDVILNLKQAGIAPQDIQTSNFSIQPVYKSQKSLSLGSDPVDHYRVNNMVSATAKDIQIVGTVLDVLVRAGANRINGITFGLTDRKEAMDEARRRAVADVRRKAELYAEAAGVTLGPILSITESGGRVAPHAEMMARGAAAAPVPVEAGQLGITAQVHVVWKIQ